MPTHRPLPANFTLIKAHYLALLLGSELLVGSEKVELRERMGMLGCQVPCVLVMLCDLEGSTCPLWVIGGLIYPSSRFRHNWPWVGSPSEVPTEVALGST